MRTKLVLAAFVVIGAAGAAYATDQARDEARKNPIAHAVPADQMKANIDRLGYDVDYMKKHDGVYNVRLTDRASGGKVSAAFDANTGELMQAKLVREEVSPKRPDEARDRKESRAHKIQYEHREKSRENHD
jgi:hypothetical protein